MPLNTSITRNGELIPLRWGNYHIAAMALAACFETGKGTITSPADVYQIDSSIWACYPDMPFPITRQVANMLAEYGALSKTPLNEGIYTLTEKHKFIDIADGEILILLPGDILSAYRGW
jgi:hypothetical protein